MNAFGAAILGGLKHSLEQDSARQKEAEAEAREMRKLEALLLKEQNMARFRSDLNLNEAAVKHQYDLDRLQAADDLAKGKETRQRGYTIEDRAYQEGLQAAQYKRAGSDADGIPVYENSRGELIRNGQPYSGALYGVGGKQPSDVAQKIALAEQYGATDEQVLNMLGANKDREGTPFFGQPRYDELTGATTFYTKDGQVIEKYPPATARRNARDEAERWARDAGKRGGRRPSDEQIQQKEEELYQEYMGGGPAILGDMPVKNGPTSETKGKRRAPKPEEIELLKKRPELRKQFKEKFGYIPEGF